MTLAIETLRQMYFSPLSEETELFVGVELEYPIVALDGQATDLAVAKALMVELSHLPEVRVEETDADGNPVQLLFQPSGDRLLFEVSYTTLEMAFARAQTIREVEERFKRYLTLIQTFLGKRGHALQGYGVNPNWSINDHQPVKLPRYQMLMAYLQLGQQHPDSCHSYPDYGAFICGNQVQLDVTRKTVIRVINAFNRLEGVKAYLFANSECWGQEWDCQISRDYFWEKSMHGRLRENVGVNQRSFTDEDDFLTYLSGSALFTTYRGEDILYFEPIAVRDYLKQAQIQAYDLGGNQRVFTPDLADFAYHRSYQFQDLTKRGTVEFRSVCTQPFSQTFAPTAFHLGLLVNLEQLEELLAKTSFFEAYPEDMAAIRRYFSKKELPEADECRMASFAREVLACAVDGLKKRGFAEETYLTIVFSEKWFAKRREKR